MTNPQPINNDALLAEIDRIMRAADVCACGIDRLLDDGRLGQFCPLHARIEALATKEPNNEQ